MINIYYTHIQELLPLQEIQDQLPASVRDMALSYKQPRDQQAFLTGRLLLNLILLSYFPDFQLSDMHYTGHGKPYFSEDFDFNISHSGELVICAFSRGYKVGVDIEQCKPIEAGHFTDYFSENEWSKINSATEPLEAFYDHWTAKEAVLKAAGIGLIDDLSGLELIKDSIYFEGAEWFVTPIVITEGYKCHIASDANLPITLKEIQL